MTTLTDLPVDIFDNILPYLYNNDIFNLLLTSKKIAFSKYLLRQCKWKSSYMSQLAGDGDLQGVKFCYYKEPDYTYRIQNALNAASEYGHLNIVEFLYSVGGVATRDAMRVAAQNGHLNIVKYYHQKGVEYDPYALDFASRHGHLQVVKFFLDVGKKLNTHTVSHARDSGNIELIQYLEF